VDLCLDDSHFSRPNARDMGHPGFWTVSVFVDKRTGNNRHPHCPPSSKWRPEASSTKVTCREVTLTVTLLRITAGALNIGVGQSNVTVRGRRSTL
jgi:hypothetical protein